LIEDLDLNGVRQVRKNRGHCRFCATVETLSPISLLTYPKEQMAVSGQCRFPPVVACSLCPTTTRWIGKILLQRLQWNRVANRITWSGV
jgi:hypothetical protein